MSDITEQSQQTEMICWTVRRVEATHETYAIPFSSTYALLVKHDGQSTELKTCLLSF